MHAARATRFGVEGTLKHGAEDGGRDAAPVKLLFLVHHHQRVDGFGTELGHLHGVVRKESAVDVRQGVEFALVTIALFLRGIEYTEEADQLEAKDVRELDEGLEVLVEESSLAEQPRVVSIETEDDAHAEHIQAAQRLRRLSVEVFLQKQTVNLIDLLTGFDREGLFLFAETLHLAVDEEVEAVELVGEIGQRDDARRRLGRLHIVDADAGKVADHDPSGPLGVGQHGVVARRLAEGGQQRAVALTLRRVEVYAEALLLDQHVGRRDEGVHKRLVSELDGALEANQLKGVGCAEHLAEHFEPEGLRVALLVAPSGPSLGEGAGGVWVV